MKKVLLITLLYLFTAHFSSAQKRTVIDIQFENFKDSIITLQLLIDEGKFASYSEQEYILQARDGKFHFEFPLKKTSYACIYMNNKEILFVPGTFNVVINPGDSLNFILRDNKLGLVNMEIEGSGNDKLQIIKETTKKMYSSYLFKKPYNKKSITEKYLEVDRSLDIIDSIFNSHPRKNSSDFRLAKAQLVDQTLDALLSLSVWKYDDSVGTLFNNFIKNKHRINSLLDSVTINYFGGNHVLPDYIYMSNRDQLGNRYNLFRHYYPLEYSSLVCKEFGNISYVKDYLLSDNAISTFREKYYGQISEDIYRFYVSNVNNKSIYFSDVIKEFGQIKALLKSGSPFYNFRLPDTTGVYHNLSDLKGKVLVLDFWFTGCEACKQLSAELSKIELSLKNDNIQFVSINVDKSKQVWKLGIGKYSVDSSLQLFTEGLRYDHPIIKFSKVSSYPTLIVLDKQGKIVGIPPNPIKDPNGFQKYLNDCL
ncbi:TlpA disulfide reductase family protein [Sphingobacterium siyangense]|uniref:TlpA family protein disulfide reductase n=1 Tax=Sphingobacterium siyangense TaxID=459529 RepID=UPI002FDE6DF9